ncbi:hypothetical protein GSI_01718 [Ganoderma sinense ZZ0214-1]|uniref:Uncharacterized protein n=1 Tax=Ganoderma sinense ZZ0214-1 TaxID=1077348 RepID=A0A2G8SR46_9APHY|nr:hypothetical protein GSI_01718 [Ganoderma sinense ZZ0214-1]
MAQGGRAGEGAVHEPHPMEHGQAGEKETRGEDVKETTATTWRGLAAMHRAARGGTTIYLHNTHPFVFVGSVPVEGADSFAGQGRWDSNLRSFVVRFVYVV